MSRRSNRASISDGEFILDCKAAYVDVIGDIRKDITNKSQLLQALQDTGRNPTERVLKKYWHADTDGISFDDFVDICRKEQVTSQEDMMKAFRRIDINGDGFLSLDELFKIMNSKGETMSKQEVKELLDSVDENGDGKLDYKERKFYYEKFCNLNLEISKQLRQKNRKRLERAEKGERRSKKVESFSDSKRGDSASMGSQISVKSNSSQRKVERSEDINHSPKQSASRSTTSVREGAEYGDRADVQKSTTSLPQPTPAKSDLRSSAASVRELEQKSEAGDKDGIGSCASLHQSMDDDQVSVQNPTTSLHKSLDSAEFGSRVSVKSQKARTPVFYAEPKDKRNGDDEDAEEIEEEEEEVVTSSRRRSSAGSKADLSSSYKSRLKGSGDHIHGSHASLRSDKRHGDDEDAEEVEEEEEEVVTSSRRRSSAGSKADLSSSYKSRLKGSGDHIHGSHASLRSAGMSGSRRSLLSVGDLKDSHSTPVPAQRKTLSRSLLAEDDMPRPSPRSNKKGAKHVPASKLGNLTEEPKNKRDWTKCSSKGCFFIDEDNGLETHNFRLTLAERSKVWITIQPVVPQSMIIGDTTPIDTMLLITRKRPDNEGRSVLGFTEKRDGKGKYGVMCDLKAGTYNLLPFTTGCHLKPRRSDSSKETPLVRKDREGKTTITKAFKKALEEIFDLSDLDGNGTLSRDEFTWFTVRTSGDKVTDDEWNVVEETVELDKNDEITKEGFVRLNEMEAEDVDDDVNDLWVTLNSMGYNKDLFIDEACPYKVDIYTENCDDAEMALTCTGIEAINHDMIMETVTEQDEGVKIKGSVYMYTYANDTRSTVVLYNRSSNHVNVTMDCASSKNCQINRDKDEYSVTLGPHEKQIAHHLMPMDETLDWTPRCVESVTK
ncbi:EF-hand calcium-binding domain-containing protein 7-like isoform X13 [Argopecten irradians]|uniref:EF-hand calcium-binding domain-containing protein 7-like isoform X13 n=1 Tax=Argopecten irradians TaxID=31199 RepID=UPI003714E166